MIKYSNNEYTIVLETVSVMKIIINKNDPYCLPTGS
jgi:hypothetical protein